MIAQVVYVVIKFGVGLVLISYGFNRLMRDEVVEHKDALGNTALIVGCILCLVWPR